MGIYSRGRKNIVAIAAPLGIALIYARHVVCYLLVSNAPNLIIPDGTIVSISMITAGQALDHIHAAIYRGHLHVTNYIRKMYPFAMFASCRWVCRPIALSALPGDGQYLL